MSGTKGLQVLSFKPISIDQFRLQQQRESLQHKEEMKEKKREDGLRAARKHDRELKDRKQRRSVGRPRKTTRATSSSSSTSPHSNSDSSSSSSNSSPLSNSSSSEPQQSRAMADSSIAVAVAAVFSAAVAASSSVGDNAIEASRSISPQSSSGSGSRGFMALSSKPKTGTWNLKKRRGNYTHWVADYYSFKVIVETVARYKNIRGSIKALQNPFYLNQFAFLSRTTLRGYFDDKLQLLDEVKAKWLSGQPRSWGAGRKNTLHSKAPDAEMKIRQIISEIRVSGGVVNSVTAKAIMSAVISVQAPEVLDHFSLSRRWVRQWLQCEMGYSYRKGTTSGQKLGKTGRKYDSSNCNSH